MNLWVRFGSVAKYDSILPGICSKWLGQRLFLDNCRNIPITLIDLRG